MADFANLVIGVNTSGLKRGERDLKQFGKQGDRTSAKIEKFGGAAKRNFNAAAIAATAALGAVLSIGKAVGIIAEFETSMSRLGAVSRATGGELEALRDIAKELGSTTEFSASQAADGLNFLAMAGFNAKEAMAAIPSVLDLATASGMGLAAAADTASNIMSGFGIAATDAAKVADVLAAASTRANTTVGQLGAAMSTVAPIASALDISLEDTAASIGVLSDAGIQGERAGTALRGVLASLAGPTSQAQEVLRGLGLTIADVDPATNDLSVVMAKLGAAGLSTADAMTLFGREAASGALVLIDGAQRVGDFGDELERADGAAGDMAATMRDNLGGDLKGVMSAAQGLAIALGDAGLTAIIRGLVQGVTGLVRGLTDLITILSKGASNISAFVRNMLGMSSTAEIAQKAIDNGTLAMGDQITQIQILTQSTKEGSIISEEAARVRLAEAQSLLQVVDATKKLNLEKFNEESGLDEALLDVQRLTEEYEELRTVKARAAEQGVNLPGIVSDTASWNAELENAQKLLAQAQGKVEAIKIVQRELTFLSEGEVAQRTELVTLIEQLEKGIVNVKDGQVFLNGELVTGVELSDRLSSEVLGINFSSAISGADALAERLGVSLSLATMIAARAGSSSVGDEVFDPRSAKYQAASQAEANRVKVLAEMRQSFEDANAAAEKLNSTTSSSAPAEALTKTSDAIQDQIDALEDAANPLRVFTREMAKLDALKLEGLSDGAYAAAVEALREQLEYATPEVGKFTQMFKDGMGDAIDYMVDGFKGGFKGLLDIVKRSILQAIKFAISNPIKLALGVGGGVAGGAANAAGGMGGVTNAVGGGSLAMGLGAAMTGSSLIGLTGLGAVGGGMGLAAGGLMSGGVGGMTTAISAQVSAAAAGVGSITAAAGAVVLPLLAIAAVFTLFKSKTTELDSGLRITTDSMGSLVEEFKKIKKKNFFKSRTSMNFEEMEDAGPITEAIDAIKEQAIGLGSVLGLTAENFSSFSSQIQISLKGLSEDEAKAEIARAFGVIADQFSYAALGHFEETYGGITREGETANETLNSLAVSLQFANAAFKDLGFVLFETSVLGAAAAREFVDSLGGLDAFAAKSSTYFQSFYTTAEQVANATGVLSDTLEQLGFKLPRTRDQFRQLVEAQDLTTESGQHAVAVLLQVSGAFDLLTTQLEDGKENLSNALGLFASGISEQKGVIRQAVNALVDPLKDAINSTRIDAEKSYKIFKLASDKTAASAKSIVDIIRGTLDSRTIRSETVELQRYQRAQRQIASFAGGASFDETSLTRATEGVSIDSQKFFGSFEDYARDFYKTQISLTSLAEKAEGELSDVETQIAIAEKAYQIAQGTYQEAQDFNVALDNLLLDLASFTETSARNQPFIDQIKAEGDRQIDLLDAVLVATTKQVNAILGVESSVADLAGTNVDAAEALGILGIKEGEMSGAVIALKTPVAEIGSHVAALNLTLAGAYDRLGITVGDLVNLDLAVGLENLEFFAPLAELNLAENFASVDLSKTFDDVDLAKPFDDVDLAKPFEDMNLTGDLETKVSLLGGNVVAFSSAVTLATGGLGINVTNLGTTIDASMVGLGSFLNSLTAAIDGLAIAKANVPTPVINLYTDVLNRAADESGLEFWRNTGLTGDALKDAFTEAAINNGEIPGFANGGMHSGGLRLVGENGPELEVTGPSRVYNNADTKNMLSGDSEELIQELRSLREEVTNLRNQNRDIGVQSVKYGKKLYDLNRQWDIVGLPATRTA